jgi:RimJ/RimL family protein N-acetyltransferase
MSNVTATLGAGYPREVETERLLLRQFRESDFEAYVQLMSTPELLHFLNRGADRTRDELWRNMTFHAGNWCIRGYGLWAIELKETKELIGRAGVWFPEGWPEIEAAWAIDPRHWGRGYATEAGREALRQAFGVLSLDHIISLIDPDNTASRRVAEKLGGTVERRALFQDHDTLFYGYAAGVRNRWRE